MTYFKITFLIAALLAALTVAGNNNSESYRSRVGDSFDQGATTSGSSPWHQLRCTLCE